MKDYILLKWGTLKGWKLENSPDAFKLLQEYSKLGMCMGAAMQKDSQEQKELICKMIDKVKGKVSNDWDGKTFRSKKAAKEYIMNYGADK